MNILILGMGHIGKALATALRTQGHHVTGTTTTPEKVAILKEVADEVLVLTGADKDKVTAAASKADKVIVTVAPNVRKTRSKEEREQHYHEVLELTCRHATMACDQVLFASSFSVYGDGGDGQAPIDEMTPTSNHQEPSSKYYQAAEQAILSVSGGCVLRYPDMYGAPDDMDFPTRVKMAIDYFAGNAIFSADAPLYAIHFEDVVASILHAVNKQLTGIYNVCDNDNVPFSNQQVFDAICAAHDWPKLTFLGQIKAPNRKISADKLYNTGYRVEHSDPNRRWCEGASS